MGNEILISIKDKVAIIALNRPKALNALSLVMIKTINKALSEFENNDNIKAILLKSATKRGFCAGGDIKSARQHMLDGRSEKIDEYFAAEYALDSKIAKFSKPIVVIANGIVMGGGLGLAGHAKFRITTPDSHFAMPEAAIGFVCDCGIDAILAKIDRHIALAFLLSGEVVGAEDALALGLSDFIVDSDALDSLENELIKVMSLDDNLRAINDLLIAKNIAKKNSAFIKKANSCKSAFSNVNIKEIINSLKQLSKNNETAKAFYNKLILLCPTSLNAILLSHDKVRKHQNLRLALVSDLKLAIFMAKRHDFIEGVRAVIIDKDQNPKWQPDDFNAINQALILANI